MVGQGIWCLAHTMWIGSSFMVSSRRYLRRPTLFMAHVALSAVVGAGSLPLPALLHSTVFRGREFLLEIHLHVCYFIILLWLFHAGRL